MSSPALEKDELEIVRVFCKIPEFAWLKDAEAQKVKREIRHGVAAALVAYYRENTQGISSEWVEKFKMHGISEDDGKSAIACARRLGIEIV